MYGDLWPGMLGAVLVFAACSGGRGKETRTEPMAGLRVTSESAVDERVGPVQGALICPGVPKRVDRTVKPARQAVRRCVLAFPWMPALWHDREVSIIPPSDSVDRSKHVWS